MSTCCARRPEDGVVDREAIERAVRGQRVTLSPTELRLAILLRVDRYSTGLSELATHFSYSRSSIAEIVAAHRKGKKL